MKLIILFIFVAASNLLNSQIIYHFDTLTYNDRMNGNIDSIDIAGSDLGTTFDGGISRLNVLGLSCDELLNNLTQPSFIQNRIYSPMQFSALPHLGFSYSFGGQGSQFLNTKYNHAFNEKLVIDLRYTRNSGLGLIRNSGFSNNDVELKLQRNGLRYAFQLYGSYESYDVNHSGGLVTDTLIEDFGLDFSPVMKSNANSRNRIGDVRLKNYINFLSDSLTRLGLVTSHIYAIKNRIYNESDTLYGIYPAIYIDSNDTRDQYNIATLKNGGGVFISNPKFYVDALMNYTYLDYQNLGSHVYISEIDLESTAELRVRGLQVKNKFDFNLSGAYNEWLENASVLYKKGNLNASATFAYANLAPTLVQRTYFSNTSSYTTPNIQNQSLITAGVDASHSFLSQKINLEVSFSYNSVSDVYYFDNYNWKRDSVKLNFGSIAVNPSFHFGVFNFNSRFIFSFDERNYLPTFQAYGRLYFKGRLFKAKKLEAMIGVDASYVNQYETRTYLPSMDTYDWTVSGDQFDGLINLHAFLTLGIDEFRFFVRYENFGYLWSDKAISVVTGYPIASTRFRIGLTWDFFN